MDNRNNCCRYCGESLEAKRSTAKWCSERCRSAARYAEDPEKFREKNRYYYNRQVSAASNFHMMKLMSGFSKMKRDLLKEIEDQKNKGTNE